MADRNKSTDVFRKKSLDRVSSPDELDKYVKTTTPSLWLLLGSIVVILVGIIVWSCLGRIESNSIIGCKVQSHNASAYIKETDYEKIGDETYIKVDDRVYEIASISGPSLAGESSDRFLMQAASIADGEWYYTVSFETELADGEYKGKAVFETISPITFIIN